MEAEESIKQIKFIGNKIKQVSQIHIKHSPHCLEASDSSYIMESSRWDKLQELIKIKNIYNTVDFIECSHTKRYMIKDNTKVLQFYSTTSKKYSSEIKSRHHIETQDYDISKALINVHECQIKKTAKCHSRYLSTTISNKLNQMNTSALNRKNCSQCIKEFKTFDKNDKKKESGHRKLLYKRLDNYE